MRIVILCLKPELSVIRELKQFVQHAKSYFDHVSKRCVCQQPEMKEQPGCSVKEACRENTDTKLLNNLKDILYTLPLPSERRKEYSRNATRCGIREVYRQTNASLEATPVKEGYCMKIFVDR